MNNDHRPTGYAGPPGTRPYPGQPEPPGGRPQHPYGAPPPRPAPARQAPPPADTGPRLLRWAQVAAPDPIESYRPEPGHTGLLVDARYFRWWIGLPVWASAGPRILVNGNEIPGTSWGVTHIPAAPGHYHVEVRTRRPNFFFRNFMRTWNADMGYALAVVPVAPGHQTPVHYRSPGFHMLPGAIGSTPHRWPGLNWIRFSWVVFGGFFALVLAALLSNALN